MLGFGHCCTTSFVHIEKTTKKEGECQVYQVKEGECQVSVEERR